MRLQHKLGPLKVLNQHLNTYPTPINLSYAYNFGSLAGIVLASQIITGILLAMHYVGHVDLAFNSVVHLMNDVPSGMILRYAHANGASLFFIVVYIHILRGVYYSSGNQPREAVWITGVVILLVMVITAFIGYHYSQKWIFNDAIILSAPLALRARHAAPSAGLLQSGLNNHPTLYDTIILSLDNHSTLYHAIILSLDNYPTLYDALQALSTSDVDSRLCEAKTLVQTLFNYSYSYCCIYTITVNTKGNIKRDITPVKSYYNLHLIETQLKVKNENKQKAGVYMVVNNINGNFYVGSAITNHINTRFRNHCVNLKSTNKPLLRSIRKYGIQNFSFHILEYYPGFVHKENLQSNHLKLLERETFYISSYKPIYNILVIGGSSLGYKHTIETRNKMRDNYSIERKKAIGSLNKDKSLSNDVKDILRIKAFERYADKNYKEQFLLKNKDSLFKGKKVILRNISGEILSEYTSIQQVSMVFSCDRKTVRKYINNGKLFKKVGYLSFD